LTGLLGGLTGGTTSTSGLDLSALSSLLGGLTGGTTSTSGLDLSSLLSGLLGGGTTISVDGTTASTGSTNILSGLLGNLGGIGNLFSGYIGIMNGIGSGDLDGFELLDSLTDLYNGAGISVDGSTASTGSADLLSGLSGLLGGNGLSSLLSGLLGGGTASTSGLDLTSILSALTGGTTSVSTTASDTTASNSAYNIIGLVNLISEEAALNGGQDVSSSTGTIIQISDDTWSMMRTTSVLNSILPGEDIFVNANGTQGIVLSTDTDFLQAALKPYTDYITVDELAVGLSITIDDFDGIQKAVALAKEDPFFGVRRIDDPGTLIEPPVSSIDVAPPYPAHTPRPTNPSWIRSIHMPMRMSRISRHSWSPPAMRSRWNWIPCARSGSGWTTRRWTWARRTGTAGTSARSAISRATAWTICCSPIHRPASWSCWGTAI
ncbi:MAG: hypothetical protein IKL85_00870, partial [Lentisphaeria bacterium]|nr:hypothetical protein [Lentisphaeria bacterium]